MKEYEYLNSQVIYDSILNAGELQSNYFFIQVFGLIFLSSAVWIIVLAWL